MVPQGTFAVKNGVAGNPWLEIEIERALRGESQISEVLGDNVEISLSFGRSGEWDCRY